MLLANVFTKSVRDQAPMVLGVTAIVLGYGLLAIGIFSAVGDEYVALLDDMPPALRAIYGSDASTRTASGLIVSATFSLLAPIILLAYGIVQGTRAAVGEEEAGSIVLLLAYPLSRRSMIISKAGALGLALLVAMLMTWLGVELGLLLFDMREEGLSVLAATIQLGGLVMLFAAFALAVAAWSGRSLLGIGIAALVAFLSYLGTTMAPLVGGLEDAGRFTPWWLYAGAEALTRGVDIVLLGIALVLSAGLFLLGVVGLERRDLRG